MKDRENKAYRTSIGGQALIEGILMRGPDKQAIVVRSGGEDVVKVEELNPLSKRYPVFGWPLIRGIVNFFSSLVNGVKALMFSAECLPEEEQEPESKLDMWIEKKFGSETAEKIFVTAAVVLGVVMSVGLFFILPTLLAGFVGSRVESSILKNLIEGVLRIAIFIIYIWLSSRMRDIHRVFEYHGAEHKSIHCYEKGLELTVENVRPQPRQHPRCGTNVWVRMGMRLLLLPLVVGISYELNRWVGRHDNWLSDILSAPGKALQRLTVCEPDDAMIEVAIKALKLVIPEKKGADRW